MACLGGLRERKREATRSAITAAARLMTVAHGLSGFTVEQVCEEVGISRRTFFNYFPSKEDAIIGYLLDDFPADAMATFLAGAPQTNAAGLSATLLSDLLELTCSVTEQMNLSKDHITDLIAAMKVEPHLMLKMLGGAEAREREFAGLIAQREHLPAGDPRASLVATVFGSITRRAGEEFFSEANNRTYRDLLAGYLDLAHQIFSTSDLTFEGTR